MTYAVDQIHGGGRPPTGFAPTAPALPDDTVRMTAALEDTQRLPTQPGRPNETMERAIRRQVRAVLAGMYPLNVPHARRGEERFPYPRLMQLIPATETGRPTGSGLTVVGKQLSEQGLGFFHPGPLPHRWVIVELEVANGTKFSFLMQLLWCRFLREGWYESGGRFSKLIEVPCAA